MFYPANNLAAKVRGVINYYTWRLAHVWVINIHTCTNLAFSSHFSFSQIFAMEFELVPLKRGNGYLIDNHIYIKNREKNGILFLKCQSFRQPCRATGKIQDGLAHILEANHSDHPVSSLPCLKFRAKLIDECKSPANAKSSVPEIYNRVKNESLSSCTSRMDRDALGNSLPAFSSLQRAMYEARAVTLPKAPTTLAEISGEYLETLTTDGANFVLVDTGAPDPDRILIFGNPHDLTRLGQAEEIHIDGTFWVTPHVFSQLVTFHCYVFGQSFPLIYALLPGKSQVVYEKLFQRVLLHLQACNIHLWALKTIISDFESGLIAAIRTCFPGILHRGCWFHFSQAVYRKIQQLGFQTDYQEDADGFKAKMKMLVALGLVPSTWKHHYFTILYQAYQEDQRFKKFCDDYFSPTWFGKFALPIWDFYGVPHRTNNNVEGFHSGLKKMFSVPHLSVYRFLKVLMEGERTVSSKLAGRIAGNPIPKPNPMYVTVDKRIRALQSEIAVRPVLDYLYGCSFSVPNIE